MEGYSRPADGVFRAAHADRLLFNQQSAISDVLVGEVWLCSGQSNMEMPLEGFAKNPIDNSASEIAAANHPLIRLYQTPKVFSAEPKEKIDAQWAVCTPETAKTFSACAYYFGCKLHKDLNVPVGLLQSCWGGTRIEPWTPPCGFDGIESLADIQKKINPMPKLEADPKQDRQFPTALYNGMLHAHIPSPSAVRSGIKANPITAKECCTSIKPKRC